MPADELTDLFVANGLVIDEEFREIMTKEEFQELFKRNLFLFSQGITRYAISSMQPWPTAQRRFTKG